MNFRFPILFFILFATCAAWATVAIAQEAPSLDPMRAGLYRVDLDVHAGAAGAPHGFVVQWMTIADHDALGGWPAAGHPALNEARFTGIPTLNPDERSGAFALAPFGAIGVQIGDLFDETGVTTGAPDGLRPGTPYAFRVLRIAAGGGADDPASADAVSTTMWAPECTQGFWKNHPERWPAFCTPMMLGSVMYTKAQLLALYATPAVGNGLISLAHQLITVKLNVCNGSSPLPIAAHIAAADALIGALAIPPVGAGHLDPSATSDLTEILDVYNNGLIPGVIDCPTEARRETWGRIKSLYR